MPRATERPFPANGEERSVREKLILVFDTLLVLSLQLVFRAMHLARRFNYQVSSNPGAQKRFR